MALIICVECNKEFSDKAVSCPNCGCPTEYTINSNNQKTGSCEDVVIEPLHDSINVTTTTVPSKAFHALSYEKNELLSYRELLEFAFTSVMPYINKELNNTITEVKPVSDTSNDVHYYIHCGMRTIGIKVVIDAYPDILNVGSLFNDDVNEYGLVKKLAEQGHEFAIARIGIGASDPVRFDRRIFIKNDGYYFDYKQLRFITPTDINTSFKNPEVRYSLSLSPAPKDESWKKIAGFKYSKPVETENANAGRLLVRNTPTKASKSNDYDKFWRDYDQVISNIEDLCRHSYVRDEYVTEMSKLICYASRASYHKVEPHDLCKYVCNAVDYLMGYFLSDSAPVDNDKIIFVLRGLQTKAKLESKYDLEIDESTLINYLIYIFITDHDKYQEYLQGDYFAEFNGKRSFTRGYIFTSMKKAFLDNPQQFGYGQDVVEEIDRLTNINSPQNIQKYIAMKDVVKNEMLQFNLLHGKVVSSKLLKFLGQSDLSQLRQFRENATALLQFVKNNFDDNLENKQKVYMDAFCKKINAYLRCIDRDEMIISKHINSKYGFFERRSDVKESQRIFDSYLYL